jgi:glycosyltransferase involved in cell wall biosynthesis
MAWYAINTADFIMVQTERQRELLKDNFDRTGTVIKNPVAVSDDARRRWIKREEREFVLWVGRSDTFHKRPLLALDLARSCRELDVVMIVNRTNREVFEAIQRDRPANVRIVEHVPHDEIWDYYRRARVFISTSAYEGFPNTFLQAAVCGAPVVSLNVDPEEILASRGCGLLADGDFVRFVDYVKALWGNQALAESYANTFYEYVCDHHDLDVQVRRFESMLSRVIAAPAASVVPGCRRKPFSRFVARTEQSST